MSKTFFHKTRNTFYDWLAYEPPASEVMPYDFNRMRDELRPGDVILIEGRSRISSVIRSISQSPWTHAALYIGRLIDFEEDDDIPDHIRKHAEIKPKTRLIIEGLLNKGTVITSLSSYRDQHMRICRPIGITHNDINQVIRYAVKALGQPYNVRRLFDLARFLLPWSILPRRWGSSLFKTASGEPESGICSSLIAEAFSSVQFPILPYLKSDGEEGIEMFNRNPYLFSPKDFDYSPYFEIIKYPLFNPEEPLPYYRRLPWSKSGLLYQDQEMKNVPKRRRIKADGELPDE